MHALIFLTYPERILVQPPVFPEFYNGFSFSTRANPPAKINSTQIQVPSCLDNANSKEQKVNLRKLRLNSCQRVHFQPVFQRMSSTFRFFFSLIFLMLKIIFDVNFSEMLKFRHFFSNLECFQRYLIQNGRLEIKMVEMLSKSPMYR